MLGRDRESEGVPLPIGSRSEEGDVFWVGLTITMGLFYTVKIDAAR